MLACLTVATVAVPVAAGVINAAAISAQSRASDATPAQTFEVASIKSNKSMPSSRGAGFQRDGRFVARNMPLRSLIAIAYGEPRPLPNFRISGGPDWLDSEGFDVEAKAAGNFPEAQAEAGFSSIGELMLQNLLAERFKVVVHKETRQLPVYALPRCGLFQYLPGAANVRHARVRFMTLDDLAKNLENPVARTVVNRTGLAGTFSFDLEFTPALPAASDAAAVNDSGTSIFTAAQEQLGLKLESTRGPVDVIVVDLPSGRRLTENSAPLKREGITRRSSVFPVAICQSTSRRSPRLPSFRCLRSAPM